MHIKPLTTQQTLASSSFKANTLPSTVTIGGFSINLQGQLASNTTTSQTVKGDTTYATLPDTVTVSQTQKPESVAGLGFIPGDVFTAGQDAIESYQKQQLARVLSLADIEKQLQQTYGSDAKLAYDGTGGNYVLLQPGAAGYDAVHSAQKSAQMDLNYIFGSSRYREQFQDVLSQYGPTGS